MAQIIRPMAYHDIDGMILNHDGSYNLPDLKTVIDAIIVEKEPVEPMLCARSAYVDEAIAYGLMHRLYEVSLVVNKDHSPKERVLAIKQLIKQAKTAARGRNISELYIFTDEPFTKIVRKLGFKPAIGDLSVLDTSGFERVLGNG